jgi:hypothetical protein
VTPAASLMQPEREVYQYHASDYHTGNFIEIRLSFIREEEKFKSAILRLRWRSSFHR